jgi:NADPH-dependent 7-cyano-7-deazaguanine reductase QueF
MRIAPSHRQEVSAHCPKWLRVGGYWYPRGGMPIDVSGKQENAWE